MFIPLHDANSLKHIRAQFVTIALIAANVIIWLITASADQTTTNAALMGYGFVPSVVNDIRELSPELVTVPEWATYVTYSFFHADFWHLAGNMLFLWVFGDNVEDALGHVKYLIFYCLCAAAGAFAHGLVVPDSEGPLIGASGAVAGIIAAYLILHPKVWVWVLALGRIPLRLPAFILLAIWIGFQVLMFTSGGEDEVSWAAHIGGIVAGAVLVLFMRRRGVPLFDRQIVTPKAVNTAGARGEPPPLPAQVQPKRKWGR